MDVDVDVGEVEVEDGEKEEEVVVVEEEVEVDGSILEKKNHCGKPWSEAKRRLEWFSEVVVWLEPGMREGIGVSDIPKMQSYVAVMPRCWVISLNLF